MRLDRRNPLARFQTARLRYAPLAAEDAVELFPLLADPAVYRHIDDDPPASVEELSARFDRMRAGPPSGPSTDRATDGATDRAGDRAGESWWNYTVRLLESGLAIGRLEATVIDDRAEIAYLFGQAYWGKGYATEAVNWLHQQLRECSAVNTFWATVRPENLRSIQLLCRTGYVEATNWPPLRSYDSGDIVYCRGAGGD